MPESPFHVLWNNLIEPSPILLFHASATVLRRETNNRTTSYLIIPCCSSFLLQQHKHKQVITQQQYEDKNKQHKHYTMVAIAVQEHVFDSSSRHNCKPVFCPTANPTTANPRRQNCTICEKNKKSKSRRPLLGRRLFITDTDHPLQ